MTEEVPTQRKSFGPIIIAGLFLFFVANIALKPSENDNLTAQAKVGLDTFSFSHSVFEQLILEAEVSYIENFETGETLYQKNAGIVRPLASLTKIMTTVSAMTIFPEGVTVTIEKEDLEPSGDHGLIPGEQWKLEDLLVFMLVASSNDAAAAIGRSGEKYTGDISFSEYMTIQAGDLGFDSLQFSNTSGEDLDEEGTIPGAVGNAEDISKLFSFAYKKYPDIFNITKKQIVILYSDIEEHLIENTNTELQKMPGVIGSKTGYTDTARGNLTVLAELSKQPTIVTVLQSSRQGRFKDVEEIIGLIEEKHD